MNQLLICADVVAYQIIENYSELKSMGIDLIQNDDFSMAEFPKNDLEPLKLKIASEINCRLEKKDRNPQRITKIQFENKTLEVDLRSKFDWSIALLISLYDMAASAINLNGRMYIFNKDVFDQNSSSEVLAALRAGRASVSEIKLKIENSWKELGFDKNICMEQIDLALFFLQNQGLVYFWEDDNIYETTAKGLLYK